MRHHWPIFRTALAALSALALIALVHRDVMGEATLSIPTMVAWFLGGVLYTQLFEHWAHKVPMHRGLPYLSNVRWNHLEHHRVFHGESFQTRDVDELAHIAGRFWVFPLLLFAHYGVLALVVEPSVVIAFLTGALVHYLTFELTHWLTHIEDNAIDRAIARVPLLADVRAYQIEHHRIHHERPVVAFNFNPPYLGDRLAGKMPTSAEAGAVGDIWTPAQEAALALTAPVTTEMAVPLTHRWRRNVVTYGAAAVAGVALVGAVVVAYGRISQQKNYVPTPEQTA